jgi:ubiquitin-protein ligase
MTANLRLSREYQKIIENKNNPKDPHDPMNLVTFNVDENNWLVWSFTILGPHESPYEGGVYTGNITFPSNYPTSPPVVQFKSKLFHPNVYPDGKLCISILHEGNDLTGYEHEIERWRPIQNIVTIFKSIVSLLYDPNSDSAANPDASKLLRENPEGYFKKIRSDMN